MKKKELKPTNPIDFKAKKYTDSVIRGALIGRLSVINTEIFILDKEKQKTYIDKEEIERQKEDYMKEKSVILKELHRYREM